MSLHSFLQQESPLFSSAFPEVKDSGSFSRKNTLTPRSKQHREFRLCAVNDTRSIDSPQYLLSSTFFVQLPRSKRYGELASLIQTCKEAAAPSVHQNHLGAAQATAHRTHIRAAQSLVHQTRLGAAQTPVHQTRLRAAQTPVH